MKKNKIIGIIPCAGKGERLGLPYPKEMIPDFRKGTYTPIFMDVFNHMIRVTKEIVIVVNDQRDMLKEYLSNHAPTNVHIYFVEQKTPVSLVHAIHCAHQHIKNKTVLFGMPDTIITNTGCFETIYNALIRENYDLTCGCFLMHNPSDFGVVEFQRSGLVKRFKDKPKGTTGPQWIWGNLAWGPDFTDAINTDFSSGVYNLTDDVMNLFARRNKALGVKFKNASYYDLGSIEKVRDFIHSSECKMGTCQKMAPKMPKKT